MSVVLSIRQTLHVTQMTKGTLAVPFSVWRFFQINKSTAKADLSPLGIFLLMVRRGDCDGQLQHAPTVAV
jgi:hypothetical protein